MRVQILCDSCCDFTATERLSSVFQKVPATVVVSGCRLADDKQFQQRALLEALRAESLELKLEFPDERAYLEAMDPGAEEIYLVTSSAAVSDQYETASRARRMFLRERPDCRIHVFNTRSGSVGQLLAARQICRLQRSGCAFRQIVERVETEILSSTLLLLPASPEGLRQGGLIHRRRGWGRLHGIYRMTLEGTVARAAAALTERSAEKRLAELLGNSKTAGKTCLISHCGAVERARRLAQLLQKNGRFSSILLTEAGAVSSLLLQEGGVAVGF